MVGSATGEDEAHFARRLFQRFEQRASGGVVHAFGGVQHRHFAPPACAGALREGGGVAHGVYADVAAGFALFGVQLGLRCLGQWPAEGEHFVFGHEQQKVRVRAHVHAVAAGAVPARTVWRGLLAQPGACQQQRQLKLPQSAWPVQQPGVPALRQQGACLPRNPRRGNSGRCSSGGGCGAGFGASGLLCRHGSQPCARTAASMAACTCAFGAQESMRTMRPPALVMRRA